MKRSSRAPSELSESLHQRLDMYTLAASAAGVGMFALAQSAEAKIVYSPAHIRISSEHPALVDLNHDGVPDFIISISHGRDGSAGLYPVGLAQENQAAAYPAPCGRGYYNYAFVAGIRVGPTLRFPLPSYRANMAWYFASHVYGPWWGEKGRYLGLKFDINGETHYGWARLNVPLPMGTVVKFGTVLLTGYAYETIPGKPIIAGKTKGPDATLQPGSLGALAAGASRLEH